MECLLNSRVYSNQRGRFMNSAFSDKKKKMPENQTLFMTKQITANFCTNSTFQVDRPKNATGKRRLTLSNLAAAVSSEATNLF